jgi:NDP-sugar pyrophosphorylase family protein
MTAKIVLGSDPWLSMAIEDWLLVEPHTTLIPIEVTLDKNYFFDIPPLDEYQILGATGFVAWGPEYLNFQRLELFGELKKKGFKVPPLIHPSAKVSTSAVIQENVWIRALCVIGPKVKLELNSQVGINSIIGYASQIKKSSWIGKFANIGDEVVVGPHSQLGDGVNVLSKTKIGKQVRLEVACDIIKDLSNNTFHIQASNLSGSIINLYDSRS